MTSFRLSLGQAFSTSAPLTFLVGKFFIVEGCPVHCRMFIAVSLAFTHPPQKSRDTDNSWLGTTALELEDL